jgi:eukaryotic-like serine/threonine-protein kinase
MADSLMPSARLQQLCQDQRERWHRGDKARVETYLDRYPELRSDENLLLDFICAEYSLRAEQGESPALAEYVERFPDLATQLQVLFEVLEVFDSEPSFRPSEQETTTGFRAAVPPSGGSHQTLATMPPRIRNPGLNRADPLPSSSFVDLQPPIAESVHQELPERIGRYRIEGLLGRGGFGLVYLARDEQLNRPVAVKVPHANRMAHPEDAELYLAEARTVAGLEHPHIVPVYDVGSTADFPFFVVSRYVEGTDLARTLKQSRLSWQQTAELVATVAEALHYAHKRGLVHRDIKPGNILIDKDGKPHVVDFGLALREENVGKGSGLAGTPSYMSPEQARGEGHRVDGRSDIFSLGLVFYELLVGRPPFRGDTQDEILEQIVFQEPRPPRQWDDSIPKELERICLKALSKRARERYTTAHDLAEDLKHFLSEHPQAAVAAPAEAPASARSAVKEALGSATTASITPVSDSQAIKIVPKGLRSFDAQDADFFLELLPGPRDRDGLPGSIRFWKTRIEQTDPDETFPVGLIYGPSGCGKSSLVKAGLLPRLDRHVLPVYVEATSDETESRLLHGLRKRCPALRGDLDLKETLTALRRGEGIARGTKVLIVLDQFEQWLHARRDQDSTELVQALRQCDGGRVQAIVMVRDDFWMVVTRFLADLEVELLQGRNFAAVDLFDVRHARRALKAYGQAYGALPDNATDAKADHQRFLDRAISGLAEDGKVICVRLALFAEMMKGKPWTPRSLEAVGGTQGVGVTFLEETFSSPSASPKHRLHQKAARAALMALLPDSSTDIKGNLRSFEELMEASGYRDRPKEFEELIRILDGEVRLITPTDPEGNEDTAALNSKVGADHKYYQLTHDYLVPSLRDWLTRKQKETRRGRAELRLADRAALWNAKPESRLLPSLWDSLKIWLLTDRKKWTAPERKMMRKAGRVQGTRCGIAAVVAVAAVFSAWEINGHFQAVALVKRLVAADIGEVPGIVQELGAYRRWADPLLRQEVVNGAALGSKKKLHLDLALLPVDQSKIAELRDDLLLVPPSPFPVVRDALLPFKHSVSEALWSVALDPKQAVQPRFQAACALATYAPKDNRWNQVNTFVAARLVTLEASALVAWRETLRPAKARLIKPLESIYRDTNAKEQPRSFATETLADYAAGQPEELFDLLADAAEFQFPVLYEKLAAHKTEAVALADQELGKQPPPTANEYQKELLATRQANAAVALLRLGTPERVWPILKQSPDPRVRSYVIHWLSSRGGDPQTILQRLDAESDVTIRRALVLTLGQFTEGQLPTALRQPLVEKLLTVYENDPDAGLHGAVEWLLRKWKQDKRLDAVVDKLKGDEKQLQATKPNDVRQWYVNTQRQTFTIVDAREGEFVMGSTPESDPDRSDIESAHRWHIGRRFAIATLEVTKGQFDEIRQKHPDDILETNIQKWSKTEDSPQIMMSWYEAAAYCNFLSEQEGIAKEQWCYEPNTRGKYWAGMKAKDKFWELTGYRLPTEAEWEYACRAGTVTSRYYGSSEALLPEYGWYAQDRAWPVGSLKPNDLGLFDMLGNAQEWCFDLYVADRTRANRFDDMPTTQPLKNDGTRVLRGGELGNRPLSLRCAARTHTAPVTRNHATGFRPARTFP